MTAADKRVKDYGKKLTALARLIKTEIEVHGDGPANAKLKALLIQQRALQSGLSLTAAGAALNKDADRNRQRNYWSGGRTASVGEREPAGVVHGKEFVLNAATVRRVDRQSPGLLDEIHATGGLPGYAGGGRVISAPFPVDASKTRILSLEEALARVTPAAPSSGRTSDWIVATVKARFPGIDVLSKDRPGARTLSGNVSYHARGRAVDFEPSKELAAWWDANYRSRTKELISPYQQYNIHNGERRRWTGAVWNQHNFAGGNAHDHIAMAGGGVIGEPVVGVGQSGRTYSFAERGPETVVPGASAWLAQGGGGGTTIVKNYNITVPPSPLAHPREIGRQVVTVIQAYEQGSGASWRAS
jgi:hypothetical protein